MHEPKASALPLSSECAILKHKSLEKHVFKVLIAGHR